MGERPEYVIQGEPARLFPVLSESSKEGRTLSILLACIQSVDEFGRSLLADLGLRVGVRARLETYTEVVLKNGNDKKLRPDGLIVVRTGQKDWSALVEAKVGNNEISKEQLLSYIELAKLNGIDAVITVSNQFAPLPSHHPVDVNASSLKKVQLFHWSWKYIETIGTLLINRDEVADSDHVYILSEMMRFLEHKSAGVQSFDQMPAEWSTVLDFVHSGGRLSARSTDVQSVVGAWYQEVRDLCLILCRRLEENVEIRVSRAHASDSGERLKHDCEKFAETQTLTAEFSIPNAASNLNLVADFAKRSISASMRVAAPSDKKTTKARVSWLLRQLKSSTPDNVYVRLIWPGRGANTQHSLKALLDDQAIAEMPGKVATSFEILYVRDLAGQFSRRKAFIVELEKAVPEFYAQVGEKLKAWQAPAPKLVAEKNSSHTDGGEEEEIRLSPAGD
ncbi:hypothetical protein [Nisaea sediminum]|uniref:hypothetical protein n=1 Tax=Nisaea sediminum TaxID=2775867 RepID=UPI001865F400|nr:hypothetical protein [Nisaea sediminum]